MTVFAYRTLRREAPLFRANVWDALGWSMALGTTTLQTRSVPTRVELSGEALCPLDATSGWERFSALGLGGTAHLGWAPGIASEVGPQLSLTTRLPLGGHSANALRAEARYAWLWRAGAVQGWAQEAHATLALQGWWRATGPTALLVSLGADIAAEKTASSGWMLASGVMLRVEPTHSW